jgi:lysophospholipase L1-like esterase
VARATSSSSPPPLLYVSLGDSYASGFQPSPGAKGANTRNGFAYQVVPAAAARGYELQLVNFGCGGATTASILRANGCLSLGPDAPTYDDVPQAAAAERFITDNRSRIALITVSIGGNDVTKCATDPNQASCIVTAVDGIKTNVTALAQGLRAAAGPDTLIVGTTYPDVILGAWVTGNPAAQQLATLSVTAFKSLINPALKQAYESVGGTFVDVTDATGAYGSLDETTTLDPYGTIPVPVAKVCELTFICDLKDIHPRTEGYKLIADLVVATLPPR